MPREETTKASTLGGTSGGSGDPCHSHPTANGESNGMTNDPTGPSPKPPEPTDPPDKAADWPPDILGSEVPSLTLKNLEATPAISLVEPSYGEESTYSKPEDTMEIEQTDETENEGRTKRNEKGRIKRSNKSKQLKNLQFERFEAFNKIFGRDDNWPTYLTMECEAKMNIAQLERNLLRIASSEDMMVRKIFNKENHYLIKTTSKKQSDAYLKIKTLNGQNVQISPVAAS